MIKGESPAERWQVSEAKVIQKGGGPAGSPLPPPPQPEAPHPRGLFWSAAGAAGPCPASSAGRHAAEPPRDTS